VTDLPLLIVDVGPMIQATLRLPNCSPGRALAAFTDPATLAQWWGGTLSTDLSVGGPYTVAYPRLGRVMTGQVVRHQPASALEFTWNWDNEEGDVRRTVLVRVGDGTGFDGTDLTLVHGPHGDGDVEAIARTEHREGWQHFLTRLAALLAT
jgi:uncharacterized protein YndB with AHSA1/START domain